MNDDPLFEATRALRELSDLETDVTRYTRAKILYDVRQGQRKRVRRSFFAIPLAALAMGSVAMAATGGYLPAPVQKWVTQVTGIEPKVSHSAKPTRDHAAPYQPLPVASFARAVAVITPTALDISTATESLATLSVAHSGQSSATSDRPKGPLGDSAMTDEEFQRYRLAHDAHFVRKDPAAALAAWNEYLAHAPKGHLALEARYNQALCLLKLGRTQEARRALSPFVAGTYGAYRKQEAKSLIASIDADAGQ